METVSLKKDDLLKAFADGSDSDKKLLTKLYPSHLVSIKITDRVKTFEDAVDVLGYDIDEFDFEQDADTVAYQKLKIIVRVLNEGWKPDWNNTSQYKWYPWFYLNNPGFRFYVAYFTITSSHTSGGSRLCFSSEELAKYAGTQFLDIYKVFMV